MSPTTSNASVGEVIPIPMLPVSDMTVPLPDTLDAYIYVVGESIHRPAPPEAKSSSAKSRALIDDVRA